MGVFSRNPMGDKWTLSKIVSFVCWVIFSVTSIHCAAQSLYQSTGQEIWVCYVVGGSIVAVASLGLRLVKRSFDEGFVSIRRLRLVAGSFIFLFPWLFILAANTHFIYFKMAVERNRLSELNNVRTNFDLVRVKAINQIDTMSAGYATRVENEILNLKAEINNRNNPGHANKTDEILLRIEVLIGDNADLMTNPPSSKDRNGLRLYADETAEKIRAITKNNLKKCQDEKREIESFFTMRENTETLLLLDSSIRKFFVLDENTKKTALRESYTLFDKLCKAITAIAIPLGKNVLTIDVEMYKLSAIPPSIDMEDIATAWKLYFEQPKNQRFIWSIILALVIDVACFSFWYFGVLSEED